MTEAIAGDFDEIFKNRYTEKDEAYLKVIETNKDNRPLCIYPWSSKPKRTFDYARRQKRPNESGNGPDETSDKRKRFENSQRNDRFRNDSGRGRGDGGRSSFRSGGGQT